MIVEVIYIPCKIVLFLMSKKVFWLYRLNFNKENLQYLPNTEALGLRQ